jgi:DNA recombination protein RmuC
VSLLVVLLVLCLFAVVAFAAYQFSAATRWKHEAETVYEDVSRCRTELEAARRTALEKEAEAVKTREVAETQVRLLTETKQQADEKFRLLAQDVLQRNSQQFLERSRDQMESLIHPVNESLRRFEEQVQAIERSRAGAYADITAQVQGLTQLQERVRQSTE